MKKSFNIGFNNAAAAVIKGWNMICAFNYKAISDPGLNALMS